ncbi:hypothetical protein CTI12_AA476010 [Artemisia annua]|uniref:DNA helicase Pif1-like 2B domain-containing protein n=1 Tax=Artemisia annua TaxID=35608 RepID=A0A2U1KXL1_ARTAN|nr:hypothetical protein CTI12_AA476010 [Artemisia annua]
MILCESDCGGLDQKGKFVAQPQSSYRFTTTLLHDEAITNFVSGISIHCPTNVITLQRPIAKCLQEKTIACPKNETTDFINVHVVSMFQVDGRSYISIEKATPHGNDGGEAKLLYPTEYVNTLKFEGLPPHRIELKIGTPTMLLRNVNLVGGLCNDTRMIVIQLLNKVIEVRIITGTRGRWSDKPDKATWTVSTRNMSTSCKKSMSGNKELVTTFRKIRWLNFGRLIICIS